MKYQQPVRGRLPFVGGGYSADTDGGVDDRAQDSKEGFSTKGALWKMG